MRRMTPGNSRCAKRPSPVPYAERPPELSEGSAKYLECCPHPTPKGRRWLRGYGLRGTPEGSEQDELFWGNTVQPVRTSNLSTPENLGSNPSSPSQRLRYNSEKSSDFSAHVSPTRRKSPRCSHNAPTSRSKRGVFYYRRRLPNPMTGEIRALASALQEVSPERKWSAHKLRHYVARVLRRMTDEREQRRNLAAIVHQVPTGPSQQRSRATGRCLPQSSLWPVRTSEEDPSCCRSRVDRRRSWTQRKQVNSPNTCCEHQRTAKLTASLHPGEQAARGAMGPRLAFAIFRANVTKWEDYSQTHPWRP